MHGKMMRTLARLFLLLLIFCASASGAHSRVQQADCQSDLTLQESRQEARQEFIRRYAEKIYAGETQNQAWIDDALNQTDRRDIHVLVENAWIKKLNDQVFKNKDLVTALTNYHKELFLEELANHPLPVKLDPYQDFKSTRLTLSPVAGPAALPQLEQLFKNTNERFSASPVLREILRDEDRAASWFRMGIGRNEAEAALAARHAREHVEAKGFSYFWDSAVQTSFAKKLSEVQAMHVQIIAQLRHSPLVEVNREDPALKLDVFAAARKSSKQEFLAVLRQLFPSAILSQDTAELILRYTQLGDEFSPSVLVAKRELLTVHNAPFGAMSIDFIGLGAENLRGTLSALVSARDLNDAVFRTRQKEREVTRLFDQRKAMVEKTIRDHFAGQVRLRFSGDDGIIVPERELTLRDQLFLIQKLSRLLPQPFFRMAVISADGAADADSSQLMTHGESIEKVLRQMILRDLGAARANQISLQVFIPDTGARRKVFLIMGAKGLLNETEKKTLRNAFPGAVKMVQEQVRAQGHDIEYDGIEIFAIFPGRKHPARKH